MTIFIIGFMGSGKSTLGRKLAAKLNCHFTDLDTEIEKAMGASIHDIIVTHGEPYFRKLESQTLQQLDLEGHVIATGGGTPFYFDNMDWMKTNGIAVYIEMEEAALFSRLLQTDISSRPLLKGLDEKGLKEFIHTKLEERGPYYYQAQIRYDPFHETIEQLVSTINELLALY